MHLCTCSFECRHVCAKVIVQRSEGTLSADPYLSALFEMVFCCLALPMPGYLACEFAGTVLSGSASNFTVIICKHCIWLYMDEFNASELRSTPVT